MNVFQVFQIVQMIPHNASHIVRYKKTPYVYLKFKAYEIFKEKSPCNRK